MASDENTTECYLRSEIEKTKERIKTVREILFQCSLLYSADDKLKYSLQLKDERSKIPAKTVSIPHLSTEAEEINADILRLKAGRLREEIKLLNNQQIEGLI